MAKKKFSGGLVYSTNKDLMDQQQPQDEHEVLPGEQQLVISLDKKQRAGKTVSLVEGYQGKGIEALAKKLKSHCGTGGSAKDGVIVIQGDNREKIFAYLQKLGFTKTKRR